MQDNIAFEFFRDIVEEQEALTRKPKTAESENSCSLDIPDLMKKAEEYVQDQFPGSYVHQDAHYNHSADTLNYQIKKVLNDPAFQRDPKGYLKELKNNGTVDPSWFWYDGVFFDFFNKNLTN